jgi:predicted enzyme related to lactoylglutathione lyase
MQQWEGIPPHWMGYFGVENTDVALEKVVAGGGKVLVPAFDTGLRAHGRHQPTLPAP